MLMADQQQASPIVSVADAVLIPFGRRPSDNWAVPSDVSTSFFKPSSSSSSSSSSSLSPTTTATTQTRNIFQLPFLVMYKVAAYFTARETVQLSATCRGFAELVQTLPRTWWCARLLEAMFPEHHHHDHVGAAAGGDGNDDQKMLRRRALKEIELLATSKYDHGDDGDDDSFDIVTRTIVACDYWQTKNVSCPRCHLPKAERYFLRDPDGEFVPDDSDAKRESMAEWFAQFASVTAFLLRGDAVSTTTADNTSDDPFVVAALKMEKERRREKSEKAGSEAEEEAPSFRGNIGGLFTPFHWRFLLSPHRRREQSAKQKNPATKAIAEHDEDGETNFVRDDDDEDVMSECETCHRRCFVAESDLANPISAILPDGVNVDEDDEETVEIIRKVQEQQNSGGGGRRGGGAAGAAGDDDTADGGRMNGVIGFQPKAPSRTDEALRMLKIRSGSATLTHEAEYWALLAGINVLKVQHYRFSSEHKRAVISRITNPVAVKSVEVRWFYAYRIDSFPRFFCELRCCRSHNFTRDALETLFEHEDDELKQILFCGYGRVEVERPPRIKLAVMREMADALGLSAKFPLSLLWNVLCAASGMAVDYLPRVGDMRLMHHQPLRNIFEDAAH